MTFDPGQLGQSKAELAETLRSMRKRASRTQSWLALRCNMSQIKLSKIETARTTPSLVDVELILRARGLLGDVPHATSSAARPCAAARTSPAPA
ncbi:helix-turn-helix transcriptional regulator [Streptomyces sp. NPDC058000]|uniref:helix-turn-helix transcriptional regulator n=1 Tax=Streptomyces sp. NPDC058000 TaxID=3346299 RepID=UPI0036EA598D